MTRLSVVLALIGVALVARGALLTRPIRPRVPKRAVMLSVTAMLAAVLGMSALRGHDTTASAMRPKSNGKAVQAAASSKPPPVMSFPQAAGAPQAVGAPVSGGVVSTPSPASASSAAAPAAPSRRARTTGGSPSSSSGGRPASPVRTSRETNQAPSASASPPPSNDGSGDHRQGGHGGGDEGDHGS
jgi:hypothetical protein